MSIRPAKNIEVNKLVEIWYEGSLIAHDFIDKTFWESKQTEMAERYFPMSENFVVSKEKDVVGFVSMIDHYLAALFIDVNHQGRGYGKELLEFIKRRRENIQLKVYEKNKKAVDFYLKNGFVIKEEIIDEQTSEKEFLMEWEKS
ncbi:GNAT family N-acetyltransferase [Virgibacillus senegalensis]|uniref:GNAT family N-acetyltransferase n=1 Tax=Virgibacillus senegalensis TaxID=1499679 RepID=UPI00069E7EBF|nr:GNAT family N-acetyltransferase [Virgibacillus senegalensis]